MDLPERYVRLCLRVEPHIDGFVDAYVGPPEWKHEVEGEGPVEPAHLRDEAAALLDELDGAGLEEDRCRWLRGQLEALECVTARLAGAEMAWADEVERCFGVRPKRTETSAFAEAHRRMDAALSGQGTLRERYIAWEERNAVPRDTLVPALARLKDVLGPRAHALASMPPEEAVSYELVSGEAWLAYNWYQGEYRSRIDVNADLPISIILLAGLAAHEAYPGHHREGIRPEGLSQRVRRDALRDERLRGRDDRDARLDTAEPPEKMRVLRRPLRVVTGVRLVRGETCKEDDRDR